jgi:hypothetical protein
LSEPKQRKKILTAFSKAWPNAPVAELEKFEGSYTEWIEKMATVSSSGKDAVESRMRSLMVRRRPAVQWLLDVVSRPEVAARHRIIKIDDDQVLSLLGLEKRGGLTYSMVEIQKNIKELDSILQKARQKQRDKQENSLTTLERRVSGLFETVSRIDQLSQMFLASLSHRIGKHSHTFFSQGDIFYFNKMQLVTASPRECKIQTSFRIDFIFWLHLIERRPIGKTADNLRGRSHSLQCLLYNCIGSRGVDTHPSPPWGLNHLERVFQLSVRVAAFGKKAVLSWIIITL